jgi:hypothetical protein
MKKQCIFITLLICTSFIHSAKQETNQSSTPYETPHAGKRRFRRGWRGKRIYHKEDGIAKATEQLAQQLMPKTETVSPIIIASDQEEEKKLNLFFSRIEFTHSGISSFFNYTFNRKEYGTDFLPHNFGHLTQFIQYSQLAGQPKEFTEGVLRLFNQKLKVSPYVSAPALERMLVQTSPYFEQQLAQKDFCLWQEIKNNLISSFKKRFSFLQKNPSGFFEDVSKELASKISLELTSPDRVRFTLLRMLTSSCDKLVWSPNDQTKTWESVKKIGAIIERLHKKKVIPDELDANDLYWSLIERYAYFLELVGNRLTMKTCQKIKQDLQDKSCSWLSCAEQEAGLQTKTERLAEALLETEIKIRAGQTGILTDGIVIS